MKAGFARLDITPPLGVHMSGYFFERRVQGVIEPLYVNAMAVSSADRTAVVLVCDLLGIYSEEGRSWAGKIAAAAGLPADGVFLTSTHTHTGPTVLGAKRDPVEAGFDQWLLRRLGDAARIAIRDLKPITSIRAAEDLCEGIAFCRRYRMKDGHYQTWGGKYMDPEIEAYASIPDETFRLVRIAREDGPELALVNFQLHPDTMGGDLISPDYPGVLRDLVEKAHPEAKCIFFNGAEGQMGSTDWWHGLDGHVRNQGNAIRIGTVLADRVLSLYDRVQPVEGDGVRFGQEVRLCRTKWSEEKREELMAEAERIIAIHEKGNDEAEIGPEWIATPLVGESYTMRRMDQAKLSEVPMTVSAVSVGGLALLGLSGEPFCEIGRHIREQSPYPVTFVCCQTNSCEGYFATAEAYDQGGYEPHNSMYPKGIAEILMEMSDDLLMKI